MEGETFLVSSFFLLFFAFQPFLRSSTLSLCFINHHSMAFSSLIAPTLAKFLANFIKNILILFICFPIISFVMLLKTAFLFFFYGNCLHIFPPSALFTRSFSRKKRILLLHARCDQIKICESNVSFFTIPGRKSHL